MANISFEGREPVQLTWGPDGKLIAAHALDSNERITFGGKDSTPSVAGERAHQAYPSFQFLTTRERTGGPARNGFLLQSPTDPTDRLPCLNVCIHGEQDHMNPNSIRSGTIKCRTGLLARSTLDTQTVHIVVGQTAHRNWASTLFRRVWWEAKQVEATEICVTPQDSGGFAPIADCVLEEGEKMRLAMLMYAEFWDRITASKEARQRDLLDLGLKVGGVSAVDTIFGRMQLEIDRV